MEDGGRGARRRREKGLRDPNHSTDWKMVSSVSKESDSVFTYVKDREEDKASARVG